MNIFRQKLFVQRLSETSFLDNSIIDTIYPNKDFHYLYIAEVEKILIKNDKIIQTKMKYENISLEVFSIVGIAVRTTNKNNQAQHDIHKLWRKFLENNIANSIPDKVSEDIYCVYTDYESDWMGNYTTIVGCKVSNTDNINSELIWKEISAANYYKFTSEGNILETLNQTWMHIWQSDYDRAYTADFDVYGQEAKNPEDGKVFTYLSIK